MRASFFVHYLIVRLLIFEFQQTMKCKEQDISYQHNMIITFTLVCRLSMTLFKWTDLIIFHTSWLPSSLAALLPIHVATEFSNKLHNDSI